jgi:hypothetical protein
MDLLVVLLIEALRTHPHGAAILLGLFTAGAVVSVLNAVLPADSPWRRALGPLSAVLDRASALTPPDRPGTLKLPGAASPPPAAPALDESKGEVLR